MKLTIIQCNVLEALNEAPIPAWTAKFKVVTLKSLETKRLAALRRYANGNFFEITAAGRRWLKQNSK